MLSIPMIDRLFAHRRFDPLLEAVAANGLALPLPLRVRLSQSPAAAVGLGLRRVAELAYGPTETGQAMARWLADHQQADGGYEGGLLATACAAAGLGRVVRDQADSVSDQVLQAYRRAVDAVARCQRHDGLFADASIAHDRDAVLLATLLVLYILGEDAAFREQVRFAEAFDQLEARSHRLPAGSDELWDLVCIGASAPPPPAPAARRRRPALVLAA